MGAGCENKFPVPLLNNFNFFFFVQKRKAIVAIFKGDYTIDSQNNKKKENTVKIKLRNFSFPTFSQTIILSQLFLYVLVHVMS